MNGNEFRTTEPHLLRAPLLACPRCESTELTPVTDDALVNFYCTQCARCWHVELGAVWRVDPNTCAKCGHYETCVAAYWADHATDIESAP